MKTDKIANSLSVYALLIIVFDTLFGLPHFWESALLVVLGALTAMFVSMKSWRWAFVYGIMVILYLFIHEGYVLFPDLIGNLASVR